VIIKWLGHSCFLITSAAGVRIVTDPYFTGGDINYSPVAEAADIVVISHEHRDHNAASAVHGEPEVVRGVGTKTVRGIEFKGIAAHHDKSGGRERGKNTVFRFTVDGVRLCHLGDLGHLLTRAQCAEIGEVDVLFVPVGGFYTIDADDATRVCDQLRPKVAIPMHFKTPKCDYPISVVGDFVVSKQNVRETHSSEIEMGIEDLPMGMDIVLLDPSR
jgi:L-ascorbate metabolism protein UlaG (beta-lactamase superfamily)